jgi:hypothetical protein
MIPYSGKDEIQCWHVARHRRQSSSQPAEFISELIFFSFRCFGLQTLILMQRIYSMQLIFCGISFFI